LVKIPDLQVFGKGGSLKGFISALLVKKATDYVMINHPDLISIGINKVENYFKNLKEKVTEKVTN